MTRLTSNHPKVNQSFKNFSFLIFLKIFKIYNPQTSSFTLYNRPETFIYKKALLYEEEGLENIFLAFKFN